ncbi:efflux transporter outer membrane subunit [Paraburkholderia sp. RL17-383-BIF-A]
MKPRHIASILACSMVLSGCSLIPEYHRPTAPVRPTWPTGPAYASASANSGKMAPDIGWKEFFKDPGLRSVIGVALENNRDLRKAALNVDASRALHRIQNAKLLPNVGAGASANIQRLPSDVSASGLPGMENQYEVALGMSSYEVDFFGKVRSLSKQALETYLASDEAQRSERIALVSEVADAYLTWRTDQNLAKLTDATLASNQKSLDLVEHNERKGIASALAVRQARVAVDRARTQQAADMRQVAQDINALELLVGAPLPNDLPKEDPLDNTVIYNLPVGLSSDVLLRRPDIQAAEHQLLSANANIGAARAAFFPSITLTASAGTTSAGLKDLFTPGQGIWTFAPQINVPIFNGGSLKASLDYSKIQKDIAIVQYEKSIQVAFREVADGLAARSTYVDQLQAQRDLVQNNKEYFALANERFRQGISTYLTVLDAQRELLSSQQQLLSDHMLQLTTEISLYKALGGGLSE